LLEYASMLNPPARKVAMQHIFLLLACTTLCASARHMRLSPNAVSFQNSRSVDVALARGPHPYGDPKCPCIGFDNMQGEVQFQIDKTTKAWYPAETGGTCGAWDYLHYPSECDTGHDDDFVNNKTYAEWCKHQWCYVDPCNCDLDVEPKISKYMPDATYQGKTLYYSYATCGERDIWTSTHHTGKAAFFTLVSGPCTLNADATCVMSPNYPKPYENSETCVIKGTPGAIVQTTSFHTEHGYDFMKIDGVPYHGTKGPDEVELKTGNILWESDGDTTKKGWKICTETQEGACVNQPDKTHCLRLDKCAWDSAESRCLGKEVFGICEHTDPIHGSHEPPCQCIGIDGLDGEAEVNVGGLRNERLAKYPMSVGSKCAAWDAGRHPDCSGSSPPSWCFKAWCYVSPCKCKITVPPKLSTYFENVYYQGKPLYYSYATCGAQDTYTKDFNAEACVNQKTQEACGALPKCAWTGKECLGKDLVETCHGLPEPLPKSSAWSVASYSFIVVLLSVNF